MARTTIEKRTSIEEQIKQLEKQRKQLIQKEKAEAEKVKMKRVSNRGIFIEKMLPHLATLSDEEFEIYIKKVLSPPVLQGGILAKGEIENDEQ